MRRLRFEQLERRDLPCTAVNVLDIVNTINRDGYAEHCDVNQDGIVSPLDALIVINEVNRGYVTSTTSVLSSGQVGQSEQLVSIGPTFGLCRQAVMMQVVISGQSSDVYMTIAGVRYDPISSTTAGIATTWVFEPIVQFRESINVFGTAEPGAVVSVIVGPRLIRK